MQRKWGGAPLCMNHMCCQRGGTCSKSLGETFGRKWWYATPASLLGKTSGPKGWSPKTPTKIMTSPYLSRHYALSEHFLLNSACNYFLRTF
jgi:hypothetical protein